ncbi:MAG: N-acetylglucosamine kinase [Thermomicrobium sp.]
MTWLIAVDGGGSKTRALLATLDGHIVAEAMSGPSNYQSVGLDQAVAAIREACQAAFVAAGLDPQRSEAAAACFGLAGVDRPEDQDRFTARLAQERLARRFLIVNDAELVLAAGCPDGWGVALISGTGSICLGRSPDGQQARAGGWGHILGDEGSGFAIAVHALRLATQTADGRAQAPTLLKAALDFWALQTPEQLIDLVYQQLGSSPARIARFATPVLQLAEAGDPSAQQVLEDAAEALARHVTAVTKRLGLDRLPLAFGGGVLCGSPLLRSAVIARLEHPIAQTTVVDDPALGALQIAQRLVIDFG